MTCSDEGMFDCRMIQSSVKIGNGKTLSATKIGKKRMTVIQKDGTTTDVILPECKYVPELFTNLFSITKALKIGWQISNHGLSEMKLSKVQLMVVFVHIIKTEFGQILAVEMVPCIDNANLLLDQGKSIGVNLFHNIIGHASEETTKHTASYYGLRLTGTMTKCEHCALAKARQKNVSKTSDPENKATSVGERLYIDISSVNKPTFSGKTFWLLVVDEYLAWKKHVF